jgi:hypothetical protein
MTSRTSTLELRAGAQLCDLAELLAQIRTCGHNHTRKQHEHTADNALTEYFGVAAELFLLYGMEMKGLIPENYVLIAPSAPSGPDFVLNRKTYDIKATPPGKMYVCCNEASRLKHVPDFIVPVVFSDSHTARVYKPIPAATVATWQLRVGHSPYRSIAVRDLQPIRSLLEVEAQS